MAPATTRHRASRSAPDSIDSLAQELSRQNLQLDRANLERLQQQLSSPSLSPRLPCGMSATPPRPDFEVDDQPPPGLDSRRGRQVVPLSLTTSFPDAMELDQEPAAPDTKRLSRQRSCQFNNNPDNARSIQTLVEGMIASGSQCNVRPAPATPLTPLFPRGRVPFLQADDGVKFDASCLDLQVDEAFVSWRTPDTEREEMLLIESVVSLRRAGAPGGVRKAGVLQYRASDDAAMSCANLVRSRPRMRKRGKRRRRDSQASSAIATEPFSSPVVPPSLPDVGASPLCDGYSADHDVVSL